jgi:hypothetical protein
MLGYIGSLFIGRAAKAGLAAIIGALGAPGAIAGTEIVTGSDVGMSILGYVVIGALGGLTNWATVYFKRNEPTDWQAGKGLY